MSNNMMDDIENTNIVLNPGKTENKLNLKYGDKQIVVDNLNMNDLKNIQIIDDNNNNSKGQMENNFNNKTFMENLIQNQTENMAKTVIDNAGENIRKTWYEKFSCCNVNFLKPYFDLTTDELKERLINSLIPFNPKFYDISQKNPDLYGPFWIYTTLIFVIAASGSLTKQLNGNSSDQFFQEFVPLAASLIYGVGFCLPIILASFMKCFGTDTSFVSIICIYGYSFSIYIPTVLICCLPFNTLQWLFLAYSAVSSTGFLLVNYWKELDKYINNRKYFIYGLVVSCQFILFLVLKFYFFGAIKENMTNNNNNIISNSGQLPKNKTF